MLAIVYHPDYMAPLRPRHRFPMSKYGYLREALVARGILPQGGGYVAPQEATAAALGLAHDPAYVERVRALTLSGTEVRRIGLPATQRVGRRARLSAAGTTLAAWLALETGLACNMAGGSHHAGPAGGAGFCVFNDVAVAALNLLAQGFNGPILIVDADVHQGDGTARIFAGAERVFTLSVHAARNYPDDKACSDLDVALPDGTDDAAYLHAMHTALETALERVKPQLAFYNAGVDVHAEDRLGRLLLSNDGIRARDRMVLARLNGAGVPVVGVLGGGYSDDANALADRHAILFEEAARLAG